MQESVNRDLLSDNEQYQQKLEEFQHLVEIQDKTIKKLTKTDEQVNESNMKMLKAEARSNENASENNKEERSNEKRGKQR